MPDYLSEQVFTQHPSFREKRAKFEFLLDAYHGTGGYENGDYLDPHTRELRIDQTSGIVTGILPKYRDRQRRAYYPNIVKTVTDVPVQYVYQSNIRRDGAAEWMDFVKDCDGNGTPFNQTMQKLMRYARLFGGMFFVVDKERAEVEIETAADEQDFKPQVIPVYPSDIIDWHFDEDGDLEWVKILERIEDAPDPFTERQIKYRVRVWTDTDWYLYEVQTKDSLISNPFSGTSIQLEMPLPKTKGQKNGGAVLLDSGPNDLGEVPLVGVYAGDLPEFSQIYATTDIYQSAIINRRIYNLFSELDEILRDQTFSLLTIPVENPEDVQRAVIGTSNGLAFKPTTGSLRPEYIAPSGDCARVIKECIEQLKMEIYRAAHLHFAEGVQEIRSGVAKAWNFDETNRFLAGLAMGGETAEKKAGRLVMKLSRPKGYEPKDDDVQVQYPGTFNISDIQDAILTTDMVISMGVSKTLSAMSAKDLASKMFPNVPDTVRKTIEKEIEESPNLTPPPIGSGSAMDAAKGSLMARVKAKRGAVKAGQTNAGAPGEGGGDVSVTTRLGGVVQDKSVMRAMERV